MALLGSETVPEAVQQGVLRTRSALYQACGVAEQASEGLHGGLLAALAARMKDLDEPVQRWQRDGVAPLGIEMPIEPGGVFPPAEQSGASDYMDAWMSEENYRSFEEHKTGAEELLKKKGRSNWLVEGVLDT